MYQKVLTPAENPAITPARLAAFGRFDVPQQYVTGSSPAVLTDDWALLEVFIAAATEQVETMAATAVQTEQVLLTFDFYPNTQDPRNFLQYELSYAFAITPWWWWGFPTKDSIELVRRPVQVPTTIGNTPATITAVSVANNVVTVTCANSFTAGQVVVIAGTAEGNNANPNLTPSTVPFLNGALLTVATCSGTQFTAAWNNFYEIASDGVNTPMSYSNNADTGTATVVTNAAIVQYYDQNGVLCTWNSTNYFVLDDKVGLVVGNWWPMTDRRQDCIQITYWAGDDAAIVGTTQHPRLQMAIMYLANHMWQVRDIVTVEPTSEIGKTLCTMLSSYRSYRIPR